jgi:hypothetical protein
MDLTRKFAQVSSNIGDDPYHGSGKMMRVAFKDQINAKGNTSKRLHRNAESALCFGIIAGLGVVVFGVHAPACGAIPVPALNMGALHNIQTSALAVEGG